MSSTTTHHCGKCSRRLKPNHWIFSRFTGNRYCWPGEGCMKKKKAKR